MKKIFLSAVIAMALCSYGYAQDEEEYEEEEAPAQVTKAPAYEEEEEEEEEAPVAKKEKKKEKKSSGGAFFGIGLDLTGAFSNDPAINLSFKLNDNMILSAIFGLQHRGETTVNAGGQEQGQGDDATVLAVGAAFDYFLAKKFIPFSLGGEFVYNSLPDDANTEGNGELEFGVMAGVHGEVAPNLVLSGKAGLGFAYAFGDAAGGGADYSRLDFGIAYKVYLTWFAF